VRALGGIVVLDTRTGESRATARGWQLGIFERARDVTPAGAGSVCEDDA
jgi:hypothetical protein